MAHAQKPDFVFRRNGQVHLNRQGRQFLDDLWSVQSTTGSRGVRIGGSNAGYTTFRGSAKGTGYPLHSPVSPSLPDPCVTVCHNVSTGLFYTELCPLDCIWIHFDSFFFAVDVWMNFPAGLCISNTLITEPRDTFFRERCPISCCRQTFKLPPVDCCCIVAKLMPARLNTHQHRAASTFG